MFSKATILALLAATAQAKTGRTHGVGYFWSGPLVEARMDPIISPGSAQSQHVHTVMGGNGFSVSMGDHDAANSKCTGSNVVGDKSNYWFPKLFFHDPKTGTFEGVDLVQLKAYYFFEGTDDVIKPFPAGFRMVSGDPFLRSNPYTTPYADHTAYDGNAEIQPISWSCGRADGKLAYPNPIVDRPGGSTQGPGFPNIKCDGNGSPLASYIHFPSCADLSQPFTNFANNTVWPTIHYGSDGSQKQNCPAGYTHLPHLFLEIHWNAMKFASRWTEGVDKQPFVLAQGDNTGFGGHADFIAGWDEGVLETLIATCDSGGHGDGLDSCPNIQNFDTGAYANNPPNVHPASCTVQPAVAEVITGALPKLPGCNPIQSGPGKASMCDCSGSTPVCNGKIVNSPPPPVSSLSSIASTVKSSTVKHTATTLHTRSATTVVHVSTPTPTGGKNSNQTDPGEDDPEDGDDEDSCDAPEPESTSLVEKPKATPQPYARRAISHRGFHQRS